MEGPRALRPEEFSSCLELVNRVFRTEAGKAPTMGEEFPLLFDPANLEHLRVMVDGGRVVCHVGVLYQEILVEGCRLPVACVGKVCTDPARRGRGLATRTLEDAIAMMRRDGRVLMIISGDRSLYARQGAVAVGRRVVFTVDSSCRGRLLRPHFRVRVRAGEGDVPLLVRLHQADPVRYRRSEEDWRRLLGAFEPFGNTVFLVERGGSGGAVESVAYLVVRHGGPMAWWGEGVGRVVEYGGEGEAVAAALPLVLDHLRLPVLSVPVLGHHRDLLQRLSAAGLPRREETLGGTFGALEAAGLLRCLEPFWEGRLPGGTRVEVVPPEGEPTGLMVGCRFLPVAGLRGLTEVLFSARRPEPTGGEEGEEAWRTIARALPVPLPDAGLNFV